jgi:hypothetical protein
MRIMHVQNIMDTTILKAMARMTPLTTTAVKTADKPPVEEPPSSGSVSEVGDGAATPTVASFKIPRLSKVQPTATVTPGEGAAASQPLWGRTRRKTTR